MPEIIDDAIELKRQRAERYAQEPARFDLQALSATMHSNHGDRLVAFEDGRWSCTCEFFDAHETCSHIMALILVLSQQAGVCLHRNGHG